LGFIIWALVHPTADPSTKHTFCTISNTPLNTPTLYRSPSQLWARQICHGLSGRYRYPPRPKSATGYEVQAAKVAAAVSVDLLDEGFAVHCVCNTAGARSAFTLSRFFLRTLLRRSYQVFELAGFVDGDLTLCQVAIVISEIGPLQFRV
jgi:hypothetical protein